MNTDEIIDKVTNNVWNKLTQLLESYFNPQSPNVEEEKPTAETTTLENQDNNMFDATIATTEETPQAETQPKDYITRQVERYEKYIEKYEKQIEKLEASDDANKDAKIASLEQKVEKYMNKIQELID